MRSYVFLLVLIMCSAQCQTVPSSPEATQLAGGLIEGRLIRFGTGEPIAGVDIWIMSTTKRVAPQKTDAQGHFRFEAMEAGRYGLALIPTSGYTARETLIVLKEGQKATGIEMRAFQGATVVGRVKDVAGQPVGGVMVSPLPIPPAGGRRAARRSF